MGKLKPKGRSTMATVAAVARQIDSLDPAAKEQACDELAASQPDAVGFLLALSRLGLSMPDLDHVLNVLLVVTECFRRTVSRPLPQITEEMIEAPTRTTVVKSFRRPVLVVNLRLAARRLSCACEPGA